MSKFYRPWPGVIVFQSAKMTDLDALEKQALTTLRDSLPQTEILSKLANTTGAGADITRYGV